MSIETMRNLNWNLLRTFVVIVERRSISKAAAQLHRSQPAVSNALKQLEGQIGCELVRRGGTRFEITEEGELLFRECRQIISRIERIGELVDDNRVIISGTLRLNLISGIACPFYDNFIREFHLRFPNVVFDMSVKTSVEVQENVLRGDIPVGFCLPFLEQEQLEYTTVYRQAFGFYCGPGHRLFNFEKVRLLDMRDENFVSYQTDQFGDALWRVARFRVKKGMRGKIVGTSPYLSEVRRMAIAGMGIAPFPVHAMDGDVKLGILRQLPPYNDLPVVDVVLVTNPKVRHTRLEDMFVQQLKGAIQQSPLIERTYIT